MLLAELVVRHTRRHMPTRRVALESAYLPTSGPAPGLALLAAVVAAHVDLVDEEQRELLPRVLDDAAGGLTIPRIAARHRLQTDLHGLDRSRHRLFGADGHLVVELDRHGAPTPQVLGAVLAASSLPRTPRAGALRTIREVLDGRWRGLAAGVEVHELWDSPFGAGPPPAAPRTWRPGPPPAEQVWRGVDPDQRWAMEVLGLRPGAAVRRDDVNRRFRRLLRDAHPDHGGAARTAPVRIAELTEARTILLEVASADLAAEG